MQNEKVGRLIRQLRIEKKLTQKQLADKINISDKTVSKWERGLGCPDISLIAELSDLLEINIEKLLSGELVANDFVGGNMKKSKYYVCPVCHNISICTGNAEIFCCGRKLDEQKPQKADDSEKLCVQKIEDDYYISSEHEMNKEHYITFVALLTGDSILFRKQYPEWNLQIRVPCFRHGMLVWYCSQHGLFYQLL